MGTYLSEIRNRSRWFPNLLYSRYSMNRRLLSLLLGLVRFLEWLIVFESAKVLFLPDAENVLTSAEI